MSSWITAPAVDLMLDFINDSGKVDELRERSETSWSACGHLVSVLSRLIRMRKAAFLADQMIDRLLERPAQGDRKRQLVSLLMNHLQIQLHRGQKDPDLEQFLESLVALFEIWDGELVGDCDWMRLVSVVQEVEHLHFTACDSWSRRLSSCNQPLNEDQLVNLDCRILEEQVLTSVPNVKPNRLDGPYSSRAQYLQTHFQLLREDFVHALRQALIRLAKNDEACDYLYMYGSCHLQSLEVSLDGKVILSIQLDVTPSIQDWETSSRLLNGSLVIIKCSSSGRCILTMVSMAEPRGDQLSHGLVQVTQLHPDTCPEATIQLLQGDGLRLFELSVYYEAYRHTLQSLADMTSLPFGDALWAMKSLHEVIGYFRHMDPSASVWEATALLQPLPTTSDSQLPLLTGCDEVFHALMTSRPSKGAVKSDSMSWDQIRRLSSNDTYLNQSQLEAVRDSLQRPVALIQGPPGTGKSYVGQVLVKMLLDNRHLLWRAGPIVVVCYTNRALDAFLESMLPITNRVLRIGSMSKSTHLQPFNLASIKKWMRDTKMRDKKLYSLEKSLLSQLAVLKEQSQRLLTPASTQAEESGSSSQAGRILAEMRRLSEQLDHIQTLESCRLAIRADVVGLTTTGAAKHRRILQLIGAKVVLVEEAGQVLEGHVLTTLTPECQQLILIGDHQQLRPAVSSYHLAKHYALDVSLFQRLALCSVPLVRLQEQHRMAPEIAVLMEQAFYPGLLNHPSLSLLPVARGVNGQRLFFVQHQALEEARLDGVTSKVNVCEAKFVLRLVRHLLLQGNQPSRITILTAYAGQAHCISKMLQRQDVNVAVVDNFQGEQNDIIVLSLVRSNERSRIGFLSEDSRVCVALSRARCGLFIVGNLEQLCSAGSGIWPRIADVLHRHGQVGPSLSINCHFHPHHQRSLLVAQGDEKPEAWPCQLPCDQELECGHRCLAPCHAQDRRHVAEFACGQPCRRTCSQGHGCAKPCSEPCHPCSVTSGTRMPCGHLVQAPCPSTRIPVSCDVFQSVTLPCGHVTQIPCGRRITASKVPECQVLCSFMLKCGHECGWPCARHQQNTRTTQHNRRCSQPCSQSRAGCRTSQHRCSRLCFQDCEPCLVEVDRTLPCGHQQKAMPCRDDPDAVRCTAKCGQKLKCGHFCKSLCHQCHDQGAGCQPCRVKVATRLECGHQLLLECHQDRSLVQCREPCDRLLSGCSHPCPLLCFQDCRTAVCLAQIPLPEPEILHCGHTRQSLPCHESDTGQSKVKKKWCDQECGKTLECGHRCSFRCCECAGGLLHRPCSAPCSRRLVCGHSCCGGTCGTPCAPCIDKKCLVTCQHLKCRARCDKECSPCSDPCDLGCAHGRCTKKCGQRCNWKPCTEPCGQVLPCGHACLGYCGEACIPDDRCPVCRAKGEAAHDRYLVLVSCGHPVPESELMGMLRSDSQVGIPVCPECSAPIGCVSRCQELVRARKQRALSVYEHYFLLECNLSQAKKRLCMDLEEGDKLSQHIVSRCNDRRDLITLPELQQIQVKVHLLTNCRDRQEREADSLKHFLRDPASQVGPDFVRQVMLWLDLDACPELSCFSAASWRICDQGHLLSDSLRLGLECGKCAKQQTT